jgi:hypothetical protein
VPDAGPQKGDISSEDTRAMAVLRLNIPQKITWTEQPRNWQLYNFRTLSP